jgi:hypothetical protein
VEIGGGNGALRRRQIRGKKAWPRRSRERVGEIKEECREKKEVESDDDK